jgi:hypothetical protein
VAKTLRDLVGPGTGRSLGLSQRNARGITRLIESSDQSDSLGSVTLNDANRRSVGTSLLSV